MKTKGKTKKWSEDNYEQYRINSKKSDYLPSTKKYWKAKEKKRREDGKYREWQQNNKDKIVGYRLDRKMHKKHTISKIEWLNCKKYFNNECAYCGMKSEDHWRQRKGVWKIHDFHKEHVDHIGANDLSNCVPSCQSCNSEKRKQKLEDWYNDKNEKYCIYNETKIHKWLNDDYKKYLKSK